MVSCLLLVQLLRSVVLVIAGYCKFCVEGSPFDMLLQLQLLLQLVVLVFVDWRGFLIVCPLSGMLLVIVATVTTSCAGFHWLEGISCCMYSFWHAACYCHDHYNWLCWFSLTEKNFLMSVLFLAYCLLLLRLLRWVVLVPGSYVVFYTCFGCKVFSLGSCLWAFIVTF